MARRDAPEAAAQALLTMAVTLPAAVRPAAVGSASIVEFLAPEPEAVNGLKPCDSLLAARRGPDPTALALLANVRSWPKAGIG